MNKTNVVFILTDDWGYGDLGFLHSNNRPLKTPNLDRLFERGTYFRNFYASSPVCSPSRSGCLTGQYPKRNRVHGHFADYNVNELRDMPNWLDENVFNVAKMLKEEGYALGHYGKWHLGGGGGEHGHPDAPAPCDYGFDESRCWNGNGPTWLGQKEWPFALYNDIDEELMLHCDELATTAAINFINTNKENPFYVNLWLRAPHTPLMATEEQKAAYPNVLEPHLTYYSVLTEADIQVGRIMDEIDKLGLTENTLIMFSSDNGPERQHGNADSWHCVGSTGGLRGSKGSLYEGGVRVPFIVSMPGTVPEHKVDDTSLMSNVDILPTLATICNANIPEEHILDGEDISEAILGNEFKREKVVMWEFKSGHGLTVFPTHAVRKDDIVMLEVNDGTVEVYDTSRDWAQCNNLINENHPTVKALEKEMQVIKNLNK